MAMLHPNLITTCDRSDHKHTSLDEARRCWRSEHTVDHDPAILWMDCDGCDDIASSDDEAHWAGHEPGEVCDDC